MYLYTYCSSVSHASLDLERGYTVYLQLGNSGIQPTCCICCSVTVILYILDTTSRFVGIACRVMLSSVRWLLFFASVAVFVFVNIHFLCLVVVVVVQAEGEEEEFS